MKKHEKTTFTFEEDDIKRLVQEKVEESGYRVISIKVNLKNKKWTEGHGYGEIDYEKLILENVEVVAELNLSE